jgi:organic radical activating enzyme
LIYLVEDFFSIQGEGRRLGTPSIFLRFGGCNMKCPGFQTAVKTPDGNEVIGCDTAYAVFSKEFKQTWKKIEAVSELIAIIDSYDLKYKADIVLTGGEPLIYADNPILTQFLEHVVHEGHEVTFETNGSLAVDFKTYPVYKYCRFALSVKLACSGESREVRLNFPALESMIEESKDSFYKFTLPSESLEKVAAEITEIQSNLPNIDTYCMPMSDSRKNLEKRCENVIEFCKQEGFIYSDRLHIRIWDEIQGV